MGNKLNIVRTIDAFLLVLVPIGGLLPSVLLYYCLKVAQIVIFSNFRPFFIYVLVSLSTLIPPKVKGVTFGPTDGWTDPFIHGTFPWFQLMSHVWPTDIRTNSRMDTPFYRDVRMHLKIPSKEITLIFARKQEPTLATRCSKARQNRPNWEDITDLRTKGPRDQQSNGPKDRPSYSLL